MKSDPIREALKTGADPHMICATCPWDRTCIKPPAMTTGDVEEALDPDRIRSETGEGEGFLFAAMIKAMTFAGRDTAAPVCPVLVDRLRSSDGKRIADALRELMTSWVD
jgi:hypothetical protein